jgi:glycosyltransferase involved in cell wall biosynthesis
MKIAVNARFLNASYREGFGNFIYEIFSRLVKRFPQHEFIFIYDRPVTETVISGANTRTVFTGPAARHPLLWKLWYDVRVPAVLRKYKADVFISCDGFCSLSTKVPQCLVIHDIAWYHYPSHVPRSHLLYFRRYIPRFLKKATTVVTVSEFSRQDIAAVFNTPPSKFTVIPNGVKAVFQPLSPDEKSLIKAKYTDSREYLVYTGAIHPRKNLINLLKAFSLFKKRLHTGMKLVIAGRLAWKNDDFSKKLKTYRYREDVVLTGYLEDAELARVTASAYAMVYPSLFEGFAVPVIEAMQAAVPVITSANSAMAETGGDAALYADPADPADIAEKMMLLYKDENLRNELVRKGTDRARNFNWDDVAEQFWHAIQSTVH